MIETDKGIGNNQEEKRIMQVSVNHLERGKGSDIIPPKVDVIENKKEAIEKKIKKNDTVFSDNQKDTLLKFVENVSNALSLQQINDFLEDIIQVLKNGKRGENEGSFRAQNWEMLGDSKFYQNEWNAFEDQLFNTLNNYSFSEQQLSHFCDKWIQLQEKEQANKTDSIQSLAKELFPSPNITSNLEAKQQENPYLFRLFLEDAKVVKDGNSFDTIKRHKNTGIDGELRSFLNKKNPTSNEFERLYTEWWNFQTEEWRREINETRAGNKREKFIDKYLELNPSVNRNQIEKEFEQIWKVGSLTVEVFLDDILQNSGSLKLEEHTGKSVKDIYEARETWKITEVGHNSTSPLVYKKLLSDARGNGKKSKELARNKKKNIDIKGKTIDELKAEYQALDDEWQKADMESSGMLNTEQIIQAAFVDSDKINPSDLFLKIQYIGRIYFAKNGEGERSDVFVDGKWGPQTQAILLALKGKAKTNQALENILPEIESVLSKNHDYGEKAKRLADQLNKDYVAGEFDEEKVGNIREKKVNLKTIDQIGYGGVGKNTSEGLVKQDYIQSRKTKTLNQALEELDINQIESSIPRLQYIDYVKQFLDEQEIDAKLGSKEILAQKIVDNEPGSEKLEELKQLWHGSETKVSLLYNHKKTISDSIITKTGNVALQVKDQILKKIGRSLKEKNSEEKKVNKDGQTYFEFVDDANNDIGEKGEKYSQNKQTYIYIPDTGEISVIKNGSLDKERKIISFGGGVREILFHIPTYQELVDKASDVDSYLPEDALSEKDFKEKLDTAIENRVDYKIGDIEKTTIENRLNLSKSKGEILIKMRNILEISDREDISSEKNKAYYEMMTVVMNTLDQLHENEMPELLKFVTTLDSYLSQPEISDDLKEKEPVLATLSHKELKELFKNQADNYSKDQFGIGKFFSSLQRSIEGSNGALENQILDIEKIKFLNRETRYEARKSDPRYGRWYNKMREEIQHYDTRTREKFDKYKTEQDLEGLERRLNAIYVETIL